MYFKLKEIGTVSVYSNLGGAADELFKWRNENGLKSPFLHFSQLIHTRRSVSKQQWRNENGLESPFLLLSQQIYTRSLSKVNIRPVFRIRIRNPEDPKRRK